MGDGCVPQRPQVEFGPVGLRPRSPRHAKSNQSEANDRSVASRQSVSSRTVASNGLPTQRQHNMRKIRLNSTHSTAAIAITARMLRDEDRSRAPHSVRQKPALSTTSNHNAAAQHNAAAETGRMDRVIIGQACSGRSRQTLHGALHRKAGYRFFGQLAHGAVGT